MMKLFWDLRWFFLKEKKAYIWGVFLLLMVAYLQTIPPKIIGSTVDHIKDGILTIKMLLQWIGLLIAIALVMYGLRYFWRIMIFGSSVKLAKQLRIRLYSHFTNMSPSFYQRRRIGDLMAHATNDLQAIQQTAGAGVLTLVDSLATGGFVIVAMLLIDWKLTIISLIPMPLMAYLTSYYGSILHKRFHKAQEAFSDLNDKTQESINGIKVTMLAFGWLFNIVERGRASYDRVMTLFKLANIHNEILQFPDGYKTLVGERGVSLSGGQIREFLLRGPYC